MPALKHIALTAAVFAAAHAAHGGETASPQRLFILANEDYRRAFGAGGVEERIRLLEAAAAGYEAVAGQLRSSAAWHNLGNARFRLGRLGESIHAYRTALVLGGGNPDTAANLGFVRSRCANTPEPPSPGPVARALLFWYYGVSLRTLTTAAFLLWAAAWVSMGACVWRFSGGRAAASVALLTLACCVGAAAMTRVNEWRNPSVAVAAVETRALSEARPSATPLFTLGEGSEVRIRRVRADWLEVTLPDGRFGWVPRSDMLR